MTSNPARSWETVSAEQTRVEAALVAAAVASFDDCEDERLHQIMVSLTRHLHSFVRDVRLTEAEWSAGIDFLARAAHVGEDPRQEFVLLSDALGVSMQTVNVNNAAPSGATVATAFAPSWAEESPEVGPGGDIAAEAPGEPCWVGGTVADTEGAPLAGARIEAWLGQPSDPVARGHLFTDDQGRFAFWGRTPTPYPIASDGPVAALLAAVERSPWQAARLHLQVSAESHRTLVTHIVPSGGQADTDDATFGVPESLVRDFVHHSATTPAPDGRVLDRWWSTVEVDLVLAPAQG